MITADARSRITAHDLALVSRSLGGDGREREQDLIRLGLDQVLDRPELRGFLLDGNLPGPSASLFFYVLCRHSLLEEGLEDRAMADYCAALLREFGDHKRANRVAPVDDAEHHYLIDILADLEQSRGPRRFAVSVHLGNYALWVSGIFADRIRARRARKGGPGIDYYEALGQRGFADASEHDLAERTGLDGLYHETASRFSAVRRALNRVRAALH